MFRRYPPARFRLEEYERWFSRMISDFRRQLTRSGLLNELPSADGAPAAVVVGPWVSTPAPLFGFLLAVGLRRRGRPVTVLWDDTSFPERDVVEQNRALGELFSIVGDSLPVVRVSASASVAPSAGDEEIVNRLAGGNVVWSLRGAPLTDEQRPWADGVRAALARALPHIRGAVRSQPFEYVVMPGGVYGTSGAYLVAATEAGARVATFDADRQVLQIAVAGVAAQHSDVPMAFEALKSYSPDARQFARAAGEQELEARRTHRDTYGFQASAASQRGRTLPSDAVLFPLNVEWDTAAIGRHVHFADTVEWVTDTISTILDSSAAEVIVRQHPSERRALQRSRLDLRSVLTERFGDNPRLHFVAADEALNSYDLLATARLVLPFVSTIGIEAAALGKQVLLAGAAHYAELGFVNRANSRAEYFSLLHRGLRGELVPTPEQVNDAWLCYYLSAVANRIATDITAQPDDFWKWCRRPFTELLEEPELCDTLAAIDTGTPVSLFRLRRAIGGDA